MKCGGRASDQRGVEVAGIARPCANGGASFGSQLGDVGLEAGKHHVAVVDLAEQIL